MSFVNDDRDKYSYGVLTDSSYQLFREKMGLQTPGNPPDPTISNLQSEVGAVQTAELAEMGAAIRTELSDSLDTELLTSELARLRDRFGRFDELREMGVPAYGDTPYQDLTKPAWTIDDHLTDVGFFTTAEHHLPHFTPEYIETTTKQLLLMESLADRLSEIDFGHDEQLALVTNIVNSSDRLSWWGPADSYPVAESYEEMEEKVVPEAVPPLQKRAMTGSLLWIDGLDWHWWQNEVLLTEEIIAKGIWDVRSMLAGVYLMSDAARGLAAGTISDENLATLVIASSAIMFIGQELIAADAVRIKEEDRKPREDLSFGGES